MPAVQSVSFAGTELTRSRPIFDPIVKLELGSFETEIGTVAGRGVFEISRQEKDEIVNGIGASGFGDLVFTDEGFPPKTLKNIYIDNIIPDVTDDEGNVVRYRLYLKDQRSTLINATSTDIMNMQSRFKTGTDELETSFQKTTINGTSAWSWQELFNQLATDLGVTVGSLPYSPASVPMDMTLGGAKTLAIIDTISQELGIAFYYDEQLGTFQYYKLNAGSSIAATLSLFDKYRIDSGEIIDKGGIKPATLKFMFPNLSLDCECFTIPANRWHIIDKATGIPGAIGTMPIVVGSHWSSSEGGISSKLTDIATERSTIISDFLNTSVTTYLFRGIKSVSLDGFVSKVRLISNMQKVYTYIETGGAPRNWSKENNETVHLYDGYMGIYASQRGNGAWGIEHAVNTKLSAWKMLPDEIPSDAGICDSAGICVSQGSAANLVQIRKIMFDDFGHAVRIESVAQGAGMIFSDESDTGADIAAIDGLVSINCNGGTADLLDHQGNPVLYNSFKSTGTRVQARLFANGRKVKQVNKGVVPDVDEWALINSGTSSAEFLVRIASSGWSITDKTQMSIFGQRP